MNWININRKSRLTRLVIPGWSILPKYFTSAFPTENLVILNPFITNDLTVSTYCQEELANEDISICEMEVKKIIQQVDNVFIFSMGLQWAFSHAHDLFNLPCIIASPAEKYNDIEINNMISNIKKSKQKTLKAFYRQCCSSPDGWAWWKSTQLQSHVAFNNGPDLIKWLDTYGRQIVALPNKTNVSVWLDPKDPIGKKPQTNQNGQLEFIIHNNGHLITPQHVRQMII